MTERWDQLKLCLWKHWILRRREKLMTSLQMLLPSLTLILLIILQQAIPPSEFETCQFRSRTLPSGGILPMVQSFACNIQNNCGPLEEFEDVPTYPGSKLAALVKYLEPIIYNETVLEFNGVVPQLLQLLNATATVVGRQHVLGAVKHGLHFQDLFIDKQEILKILVASVFDKTSATALLEAEVRLGMIIGDIAATTDPLELQNVVPAGKLSQNPTQLKGICDSNLLKRYLRPGSNPAALNMTIDYVISLLCDSYKETFPQLVQQLNVEKIESFLKAANDLQPDNLAKSVNMTRSELDVVASSMEAINLIYPNMSMLLMNLSREVNITDIKQRLNVSTIGEESYPDIMNNFLCGQPLKPVISAKYYPIHPVGNGSSASPLDLRGCHLVEHNIKDINNGVIFWLILRNILQGEILFTPANHITNAIAAKASQFFKHIESFLEKLKTFAALYHDLKHMNYYNKSADLITELFFSSFFKDWTDSKFTEKYNMKFLIDVDVIALVTFIDKNINYIKAIDQISSALECVNTDRFVPVDDEDKLIEHARNASNHFLAGIVFHSDVETSPKHLQYKIRMDVDNVPHTTAIREKLWVPGPEGDFYYNMRYFWGFLQIQDLLDNAIIELQTGQEPADKVFMQQFPYPCFMRNNFLSGLYTAQLLPVVLIFGYAVLVCLFVHEFVWEQESGNMKLLQLTGLNTVIIWLSNFIVMALILLINSSFLTLILCWGRLIPLSQPSIIWIALNGYSFSLMTFVLLIASLLRKSSSGSVVTFLIFILTLLPFFVSMALEDNLGTAGRVVAHLFMSSAFSSTMLYITSYEQKQMGVDWHTIGISPMENDSFNLVYSFLFILLDGIIHGIIGLVIITVRNRTGSCFSFHVEREQYLENMQRVPDCKGVKMVNICKEYATGRSHRHKAVKNLTISFEHDQITGLLGHNGAGKTTTMGILTGMLTPTSGKVIIDGHSFHNESYIKDIGYCPQQGILYDNMTVKEHLTLYASIGMRDKSFTKSHVEDLMMKMNLLAKETTQVKHLSEGLRRCLAVGMAFARNSSLVVLDEPTSGVDSAARRLIWDFIQSCKAGRTIIISTHHMDEAEILCDTIAILHHGKLVSHGTLPQLLENLTDCVHLSMTKKLDSSTDTQASDAWTDIDMKIHSMTIGSAIITSGPVKALYKLPLREHEDIGRYQGLFDILEREMDTLGVSSFSISYPTLEDVFSTVTWDSSVVTQTNKEGLPNFFQEPVADTIFQNGRSAEISKIYALLLKRFWSLMGDKWSALTSFSVSLLLLVIAMVLALLRPDTVSPAILLTPSLYGPGSLSFTSARHNSSVFASLIAPPGIGTTCMPCAQFDVPVTACVSASRRGNISRDFRQQCHCRHKNWRCEEDHNPIKEISLQYMNTTDVLYFLPPEEEPNNWILNTHYEFIEKLYGGWKLGDNEHFVYYNNKGFHSSSAYLNAVNNARLRAILAQMNNSSQNVSSFGISTYSHPFRRTSNQAMGQSLMQHISDNVLALLLVAVLSVVPSRTIIYLIVERITEEKQVQRSFAVRPAEYWTAALLWDSSISLVFLALAAIIIKAFGVKALAAGLNYPASLVLIFCYFSCMNCFVYLLEKGFQEASLGQIVVLAVSVFIGIGTLVLMLLLYFFWWIQTIVDARKILNVALLVLPPFAAGAGFLELIQNQQTADLLGAFGTDDTYYQNPFSWDIAGKNMTVMVVEAMIFFLFNLTWEILKDNKKIQASEMGNHLLALENVSKRYLSCGRSFSAVKDMNLTVGPGECVGLIGLNGAGKSTTFQMIVGKLKASGGAVRRASETFGYCPQANSLDMYISVEHLLKVYSTMAGICHLAESTSLVDQLITTYGLQAYRHVLCGALSGGNKRKVCAAIAAIGQPSLILMDEPTSGMDPKSRRLIWARIRDHIKAGQSVLLTSHSLLETDELCDRVAIMMKGDVVCSGSPGDLRDNYGLGYKINIKMNQSSSLVADITDLITSQLGSSARFLEERQGWVKFAVNGKLSELVGVLSRARALKAFAAFTITATALEDIFLHIVGTTIAEQEIL